MARQQYNRFHKKHFVQNLEISRYIKYSETKQKKKIGRY